MEAETMNQLPVFNEWTVDIRLKQFRKTDQHEDITFLDFASDEGHELLREFIDTLQTGDDEHTELLESVFDLFDR
jgi:hypothetical protein